LKVIPPTRDANVLDSTPILNVGPFAMCQSMANPTVASATAANRGVLTPMPCVPACASAWVPGDPTRLVEHVPALTRPSTLMCAFGGQITIVG
jgi:hypothetical protein